MGLASTRIQQAGTEVGSANPLYVTGGGTAGSPSANVTSVQGFAYYPTVSITRPSNTTAYDAGDVIGIADAGTPANAGSAIHSLTAAGPSGGTVIIIASEFEIDVSAVPSGMNNFRLHLYNASPTAILDNAAWDHAANDRTKYLGFIDLGTPVDQGSTLFVQAEQYKPVKLATGSTTLYAELVTVGGYTPTSGAVKKITLHTITP